jgi:SAM-dependent methyltransferase
VKLAEIYRKFAAPDGGGDKGTAHSYIEIYESEMTKTEGISLLEIGVWQGHSIKMWQEYFSNSEIIGVDITKKHLLFSVPVLLADATEPIQELEGMTFDYIIDDGSHLLHDQINAFNQLWDKVKEGGKYFIEDIIGDAEMQEIQQVLSSRGIAHKTYDNRQIKGRSDDILIVATKAVS